MAIEPTWFTHSVKCFRSVSFQTFPSDTSNSVEKKWNEFSMVVNSSRSVELTVDQMQTVLRHEQIRTTHRDIFYISCNLNVVWGSSYSIERDVKFDDANGTERRIVSFRNHGINHDIFFWHKERIRTKFWSFSVEFFWRNKMNRNQWKWNEKENTIFQAHIDVLFGEQHVMNRKVRSGTKPSFNSFRSIPPSPKIRSVLVARKKFVGLFPRLCSSHIVPFHSAKRRTSLHPVSENQTLQ